MKRKELSNAEKLAILKLLAQTPREPQEAIAEKTHHRKQKIVEVLKEFKKLSWEEAKAFCNNNQHILGLREDYIDRKTVEAEELEEMWDNITTLRMEQGLPFIGIPRRQ